MLIFNSVNIKLKSDIHAIKVASQKQTIVKCFILETANMTVNVRKMRKLILLWQYGAVIIST